MTMPRLAVGTVSKEVVDATVAFSATTNTPIALISSLGQVDNPAGYLENWTTEQYFQHLKRFDTHNIYRHTQVTVCRDHLGPGFGTIDKDNMGDFFLKLTQDGWQGFDILHLDVSFVKDIDKKIDALLPAMKLALSIDPHIIFEIGLESHDGHLDIDKDEDGKPIYEFDDIKKCLDAVCNIKVPDYYACNTGSLVMENRQCGKFNAEYCTEVKKILDQYKVKFKEHNADYLSSDQIKERVGIIDTMNIAPQLAAVQTQYVLLNCAKYGIDICNFINLVYNARKWEKWDQGNLSRDRYLSTVVGGHYHYQSQEWKEIIQAFNHSEGITGDNIPFFAPYYKIREQITDVLTHYVDNFK
jgi:hypothetical protein